MTDWVDAYVDATDSNRKYELLREEMTRLRGRRNDVEFFDESAVVADVRRLNDDVAGDLVAFVANDFGRPRAYRPEALGLDAQDDVRQAILEDKYDDANDDLDAIRCELLDEHSGIHKAIVAEYEPDGVRYHLPEGSNDSTNFLTVREMVGLIDYTTNSFQRDGLSVTY
ncbi:hypothetical protein G9C85_07385 [Halorubellus sp. JP-L1]|uniref:hypothetical protein n=1 Tax=Halorubellus sp. JP-L1 TaxID=2715753 RepID=UPI0014088528|nr:hypothetical protein [Halorubellus sp. JP-L1]NHN41460.1 hypothetical protein [Halorubellus sp. JP-L1]